MVTRARNTPRLTGPQDLRPATFLLDLYQDQDDLFTQPARLLQGSPPRSPQDKPDGSDPVRLRMPTAEVLQPRPTGKQRRAVKGSSQSEIPMEVVDSSPES